VRSAKAQTYYRAGPSALPFSKRTITASHHKSLIRTLRGYRVRVVAGGQAGKKGCLVGEPESL